MISDQYASTRNVTQQGIMFAVHHEAPVSLVTYCSEKGHQPRSRAQLLASKGVSHTKTSMPFLKPAILATAPDRLPSFLPVLGISCRTGVPEMRRLVGGICRERRELKLSTRQKMRTCQSSPTGLYIRSPHNVLKTLPQSERKSKPWRRDLKSPTPSS